MRRIMLSVVMLVSVLSSALAEKITITATVPNETNVCFFAGGPNGWSPSTTEMTKVSDSPKKFSCEIEATTPDFEYKILAGPAWAYESVVSDNFKYSVDGADVSIEAFKAYANELTPIKVNVMAPNNTVVLYITGSYNNWKSPQDELVLLSEEADGKIYTITLPRVDLPTFEFKFCAGPAWDFEQVDNNFIASENLVDGEVFVVCSDFKAIYDPAKVGDITVNIKTPTETPDVFLVGSFNGWSQDEGVVKAVKNEDGTFTAIIPMIQSAEFKCYSGKGWEFEECNEDGTNVENRKVSFMESPTIDIEVAKWKSIPTGLDLIFDSAIKVFSIGQQVVVQGASGSVNLYNIAGQIVDQKIANGRYQSSTLVKGIYIVKVGTRVQKVAVQ